LNSREQTVLSGPKEAVDAAEKLAVEKGARKAIRLTVAGAFHSTLMKPAADRLREVLADIQFAPPSHPVVANLTGLPHEASADAIRDAMVAQVHSPVRWVHSMEWMQGNGVSRYIECGPGKVLSGLLKRIDKQAEVHMLSDFSGVEALG
jgi:[acyl-carrier-protein] S-malonyltransferase